MSCCKVKVFILYLFIILHTIDVFIKKNKQLYKDFVYEGKLDHSLPVA